MISKPNISNSERIVSLAAGAALWAFGRATSRRMARNAGWALLGRGALGFCPVSAVLGRNTAFSDTRLALGGSGGVREVANDGSTAPKRPPKPPVTISQPIIESHS